MKDFLDDLVIKAKPKVKIAKPKPRQATKDKWTRDAVKTIMTDALKGQESDVKALARVAGRNELGLLQDAFSNFESAVGGREALISVLAHCPPTSVGAQMIGKLTTDDDGTNPNAYTLYQLCKKHKLGFNLVVQAFRDAKLAQVAINTLNQVAADVPEVVSQLIGDAKNRWEGCTICEGTGRIQRINEVGEYAFDPDGKAVTQLCFDCRGKGRKFVRHDFSNRSKLLDLAGLRPDKGPLVQQTFNQNAQIGLAASSFMPGDGSFESLMQAVEATLNPTTVAPSDERIVDVEIIPQAPPDQEADESPEGEPQQPPGLCEVD